MAITVKKFWFTYPNGTTSNFTNEDIVGILNDYAKKFMFVTGASGGYLSVEDEDERIQTLEWKVD
jgi:hypothetical protein